jgi:uncharacterized protein
MPLIAGIDPVYLKEIAHQHEEQIDKAIKSVKKLSSKQADQLVNEIHHEVFLNIDCLQCANCCKTTSPLFTQEDIGRISSYLGLSRSAFVQQYLIIDEDGDFVFNRPAPCPFLGNNNMCSVYSVRPEACAGYPHTGEPGQRRKLKIAKHNAVLCPGVFRILERVNSLL